jgi:hypothetical protein
VFPAKHPMFFDCHHTHTSTYSLKTTHKKQDFFLKTPQKPPLNKQVPPKGITKTTPKKGT